MNKVSTFIALIFVLAILQLAVNALVAALILALLISLIARPRETVLFLGTLTIFSLASARPLAFIIALAVIGVAGAMAGGRRKTERIGLLVDHTEEP